MGRPDGRASFWVRAGGEFLVIVVGVLVAFQVEEWRENQELREREQVQLEALRADFRENLTRLESVVADQRYLVGVQGEVIRIINGDSPRPDTDSLSYLVNRTLEFYRPEVVTGAYEALVGSGDLRLIRNTELRGALAAVMGELGFRAEDESISEILRAELFRTMAESTSFFALMRPAWRESAGLPRSSAAPDLDALFANEEYLGYLAVMAFTESALLEVFDDLRGRVQQVLALLEEEIG
jgi:hypothetical protein